MKVILRESYETLGRTGDIVDVKPGFARNFLVPQGVAYPANNFYKRRFEAERADLLRADEEKRTKAESVAERATGATVEFEVMISERGQMFGAITNANIAEALAEKGIEVDRRKIVLPAPIKNLGEHTVTVRPHGEVEFDVNVIVKPTSEVQQLRVLSIRELIESEAAPDYDPDAVMEEAEAEQEAEAEAEAEPTPQEEAAATETNEDDKPEVVEIVEATPVSKADEEEDASETEVKEEEKKEEK